METGDERSFQAPWYPDRRFSPAIFEPCGDSLVRAGARADRRAVWDLHSERGA